MFHSMHHAVCTAKKHNPVRILPHFGCIPHPMRALRSNQSPHSLRPHPTNGTSLFSSTCLHILCHPPCPPPNSSPFSLSTSPAAFVLDDRSQTAHRPGYWLSFSINHRIMKGFSCRFLGLLPIHVRWTLLASVWKELDPVLCEDCSTKAPARFNSGNVLLLAHSAARKGLS